MAHDWAKLVATDGLEKLKVDELKSYLKACSSLTSDSHASFAIFDIFNFNFHALCSMPQLSAQQGIVS